MSLEAAEATANKLRAWIQRVWDSVKGKKSMPCWDATTMPARVVNAVKQTALNSCGLHMLCHADFMLQLIQRSTPGKWHVVLTCIPVLIINMVVPLEVKIIMIMIYS